MSWNGSIALTSGAAWSGSPQVITSKQFQSTNSATIGVFDAEILSTGQAVIVSSNVLQTQVNAIAVSSSSAALWANFRAITNVDLSGNNLYNAKSLSTMALQVSSINGSDIQLFGSTVVVGGVTIVNNTVQAATVEKTNSVLDTVNQAAGAVGKAVSAVNTATTGALNNFGTVLQQVYWGTAAVDSVVSLTNGVVELATGIQGLVDSRQKNTISGPAGPPGQTTNVYETFNHTTQLQFSTLGSDIYTVLRTTDQKFPNQTLGREVFISTFIPAGSKVVRSLSDPMSMPIMSTQILSTTNFAQSFGQWSAVLSPDYNLKVSSLQVANLFGFAYLSTSKISTITLESSNVNVNNLLNTTNLYVGGNATVVGSINSGSFTTGAIGALSLQATSVSSVGLNVSSINGVSIFNVLNPAVPTNIPFLSSLTLSTGSVQLSSINGQPISVYVNSGNVVFDSVSTLMISTGRALISSINDSIRFTNQPTGNSIAGINDLTAATATFNTSLTTNGTLNAGTTLLGATRVTGLFRVTDGGGANVATVTTAGAITGTSLTTGGGAISGGTGSFSGVVTAVGVTSSGAISGTNTLTITGGTTLTGGNIVDTIGGATANFTTINSPTANLTNANITNTNTTNINAGSGTLNLSYGSILFNGSASLTQTPLQFLSSFTLSTGSIQVSSINGVAYSPGSGTLPPGIISTPNLIGLVSTPNLIGLLSTYVSTFTNFNVSYLQASTVNITGGLVFSTIGSAPDITNIFTSSTTAFDSVSSATNDILNYQMNLTSLPATFDMGGFLDITSLNRSLWLYKSIIYSGQYTPGQNPTLNLVGAVTSGDFFDIKNTSSGAVLSVWNPYESGGFLMNITPGQFYRFTYTTSWSAVANPTQTTQTATNLLSLSQGWTSATISTNNILNINAGQTNILGFAQIGNANINDLTAQQATIISSQTVFAKISSLTVSSLNLNFGSAQQLNISTATVSTINGFPFNRILNDITPFLSAITISTAIENTSTINMIGQMNISTNLVFSNSPVFDITKTISLTSTSFSTISSFQNNILSYTYNATVGDETAFDIGAGYNLGSDNVAQWASTILLGTNEDAVMTIEIDNDPSTGFLGTGTFDAQRKQLDPSNPPYDILVQYSLGGATIVDIPFNDFRIYRFTKSTAGTPVNWTYDIGPPTYQTVNSNIFQITQNLTDVTLSATDNLNINAGSIKFNGSLQLSNVNVTKGFFSTINAATINTTNLTASTINSLTINSLTANTTNLNGATIRCSTLTTSNIQNADAILVQKFQGPTPLSLNALTNQYVTLSGGLSGTNARAQTNQINFLALPGMVDAGIPLGFPAGTTLTFTAAGTTLLNGNPGFPSLWYSSITSVDNSLTAKTVNFQVPTGGNGQVALLTNGINNVTVQSNATTFGIIATIGYSKLSWNAGVFSIVNAGTVSPYPSTMITQDTRIQTGANNAMNLINKQTLFNQKAPVIFYQNFTGFFVGTPGSASGSGVLSYNGSNFATNQWSCYLSFYNINLAQNNLAINNFNVTTTAFGSNWGAYCYTGVATAVAGATSNVNWNVQAIMVPKEFALQQNFNKFGEEPPEQDLPPSTFTSTVATFARLQLPEILVSSMTASTIAFEASENMSLLAGIAIPSFLGTGNILVAGTASVEIAGDQAVVGGLQDVNIAALNGSLFLSGNSTIQMTASTISMQNYVDISGALFTPQVLGLSSINGYPFIGGSSWVGTATSDLDMCNYNINNVSSINGNATLAINATTINVGGILTMADNPIRLRSDQYHALAFGDSGTYDVNVNGPYLVGYNNGALGTSGTSFNNKSLEWSYTDVYIYKPLDMCNNDINNASTIKGASGATLRLQNNSGGNFFQLENGGNIYMVANSGATNGGMDSGLIFWAGQNITSKVFGATSAHTFEVYDGSAVLQKTVKINSNGLDMCNAAITNLSSIYFTQGAALTTNAATWTSGSLTTLIGDEIGGDKYIQWSYDNNPGTLINDNHSISLSAPVINSVGNLDMCNNNIKTVGLFSRMLSATSVDQPILQFGEDNTGTGASGSVVINLPTSYTSASSYVAFATMEDSDPAEMSVVRVSATSIEIYWQQGSGGSHVIAWNTMGT